MYAQVPSPWLRLDSAILLRDVHSNQSPFKKNPVASVRCLFNAKHVQARRPLKQRGKRAHGSNGQRRLLGSTGGQD